VAEANEPRTNPLAFTVPVTVARLYDGKWVIRVAHLGTVPSLTRWLKQAHALGAAALAERARISLLQAEHLLSGKTKNIDDWPKLVCLC
jgi:hypothetical protein